MLESIGNKDLLEIMKNKNLDNIQNLNLKTKILL